MVMVNIMVLAHDINQGLRTQDVQISEDVTFDTMLLTQNTLQGLTKSGFYKPSPIQLHGIPLGKCGFDLLLEAKSGTGKTAVFTVIALEKLDLEKGLQTIILAPTREIAAQTFDVITQIGTNYKNLQVELSIGGLPVQEDIIKFKKKVHIVVGSPGRIRHLIQDKHIDVSSVRLLVLDEADKLMEKNFQADINYIFSVAPKEKQVIMSSATYPETLMCVMNKYVQNVQHICPDSTNILLGIKQLVITVKTNSNIVRQTQNRFEELLKILSKKNFKQCLIFCNYQVRVKDLCKMLMREKWPAEQLHGQQEQTDRLDALKTLQEYKCRILISTDLAARGIDASNVDLVINFEPPYDWQTYLHRIGRAGRYGSYGIAITILCEGQEEINFKKMMITINHSLDLKNFWDDEKFDLEEHDSSLSTSILQNIDSNYVYNELLVLNKLTHGDVKDIEETDSFNTLCDSFNKTNESEIESFDDLLTCFKSHKYESETFNNKFSTKSNNDCSLTFDMQTNRPLKLVIKTEVDESLTKPRDTIKLTNERQKQTETQDDFVIKRLSYNNKTQLQSRNKKTEHEINGTHNRDEKDINIRNGLYDLDEFHINKIMLEAGLPTSFSSSKHVTRKPKKANSKCFNHNRSKYYAQQSRDIKPKETGYVNMYLPVGDTDLSGKQVIHNSLRKVINNVSKMNYKQSYHSSNAQICRNEEINNDIHKSYVIWYSQLKTHIEHIQMALYIEELSRM